MMPAVKHPESGLFGSKLDYIMLGVVPRAWQTVTFSIHENLRTDGP